MREDERKIVPESFHNIGDETMKPPEVERREADAD
jgi:hypothetical protein